MTHNDYAVTCYVVTSRYRAEEGGYFAHGIEVEEQYTEYTLAEARAKFHEYVNKYDAIINPNGSSATFHFCGDNFIVAIERNGSRRFGSLNNRVRHIDPFYS